MTKLVLFPVMAVFPHDLFSLICGPTMFVCSISTFTIWGFFFFLDLFKYQIGSTCSNIHDKQPPDLVCKSVPSPSPLHPFSRSSFTLKQWTLPPFFSPCIDLLIVLSAERVAGPGSHPHRVWMVSPLAAVWSASGQSRPSWGHPSI